APAKEDPELLERAYERIAAELSAGELVGLFPEGRLTSDGEMSEFRGGVMRILEKTPVPVVPMALSGLWQSLFARTATSSGTSCGSSRRSASPSASRSPRS